MILRVLATAGAVALGLLVHSSAKADDVQFSRDVRPILSNKCFKCHGPDEQHREAELRLDQEADVFADRDGQPAVKRGDLKTSVVWQRITSDDHDLRMPPAEDEKPLTKAELDVIRRWIEQGAVWQGHWSFEPAVKPAVPVLTWNPKLPAQLWAAWSKQAVDRFVAQRMLKAGLTPSEPAAKELLIRRVTFDLTGLPPTLAEVDAFLTDKSEDAYEKLVDRLLARPQYGERMTVSWLDAARYGDSSVYHADGPRDMWAWRDWVIKAFNDNMPYDQFTVEQLAGDLLPNATVDQKVAAGFNRNHGTTDEGGAIDEEYRVEYVVDRVNTTSTVWLGLTMQCGQCHDHKYDPITQKEFYQFYAFFNQSADRGMQTRKGNATPLVEIPKAGSAEKIAALKTQLAKVSADQQTHMAACREAFDAWLAEASTKAGSSSLAPGDAVVHLPLDEAKGNMAVNAALQAESAEKAEGSEKTEAAAVVLKGKVNGAAKWSEGRMGGCLEFDGKNFVDVGSAADFERTDSFSYGCWIQMPDKSTGAALAKMDDGAAHRGFDLFCNANRVAVHLIHAWPNDAVKVNTKAEVLKPKEWRHVFVTYDGSSKAAGLKIYVDGKDQPWTIEKDALTGTIRTEKPLYLGRRNPGSPFKGKVDDVRIYSRALTAGEVAALAEADPIKPLLALAADQRTPQQTEQLRGHYFAAHDPAYQKLAEQAKKLQAEADDWAKPLTSVMTMADMARPTYVLERGHYASPRKDEVIQPGVPSFLPGLPEGAAKNRLGLAQWIVDPKNPLTARVTVNRVWYMLFGMGLVESVEDFGSQGNSPTHPELLDWLAVDFVEHGWDVKRLVKQIVTSQTYRQSSKSTPALTARDPRNELLARGPRQRLQAEFLRDQALAVAGLLRTNVGGPSVKPYQPPGLWQEVSLSGERFVQDHGDALYRRTMYTYLKRSAPAPSLMIFDAPGREQCTVRRQTTNTPLQALVTLNDPQYVEAARFLAQRMMLEAGETPQDRVRFGHRLATARVPRESAEQVLLDVYRTELERFLHDPKSAADLLSVGESKRLADLPAAEHAAWTIVAGMLLNMDETLNKN